MIPLTIISIVLLLCITLCLWLMSKQRDEDLQVAFFVSAAGLAMFFFGIIMKICERLK